MKVYCGADPGLDGAIVGIDEDQRALFSTVMPTLSAGTKGRRILAARAVLDILRREMEHATLVVALEEPGVRPKNGAVASMATGRNHGKLEMALIALDISYVIVRPQAWYKALGIVKHDKSKDATIAYCERMLPTFSLVPKGCRKPHSGLADAACLALYALRERL